MVKLLIVCHGELAAGLIDAMELIAGPQEGVTGIGLGEADSIEELEARIEAAVEGRLPGEEVLILVDMLGASPFNASSRVACRMPGVEVVTGVNLPILLETAMQREDASLADLTRAAREAGSASIKVLSELMGSQRDLPAE